MPPNKRNSVRLRPPKRTVGNIRAGERVYVMSTTGGIAEGPFTVIRFTEENLAVLSTYSGEILIRRIELLRRWNEFLNLDQ